MRSLFAELEGRARAAPDAPVLRDASLALTRCELQSVLERFASAGFGPERLIVSLLPSGVGFAAALLASLQTGARFLPLAPGTSARELRRVLRRSRPAAVLFEAGDGPTRARLEALELPGVPVEGLQLRGEVAPIAAGPEFDRVALVQPTSGSTGQPKLLLLEPSAVEAGIRASRPFALRFEGGGVAMPIPLFHAMGSAMLLEHLFAGSWLSFRRRFVPGELLGELGGGEVALLATNPSSLRLLERVNALPRLRVQAIAVGSAATEPALLRSVRDALPRTSIHLRYGLSEAFGALTRADLEAEDRIESEPVGAGYPLPGVEIGPLPAVGAPEPVRVRSASLARGQLGRSGWLDEDGFLDTGDLGCFTERGLVLKGRKSQFIKRNGYRVDPSEVEQTLVSHPEVEEAVVVGVPDPVAGHQIVAVVEGEPAPSELRALCRQELSDYKLPRKILVGQSIPRTASGKPDRPALAARLSEKNEP